MTQPVYTVATVFTWVNPWEQSLSTVENEAAILKSENSDLLARSEDFTTDPNITTRHWTNVEDAQAWLGIFSAFIAEYNLNATGNLADITSS